MKFSVKSVFRVLILVPFVSKALECLDNLGIKNVANNSLKKFKVYQLFMNVKINNLTLILKMISLKSILYMNALKINIAYASSATLRKC
jgi:hypothetical protein